MSESLNDTVIGVFNNWFLKQHGLLPQQAIARITELQAKLDAVKGLSDRWRSNTDTGVFITGYGCADELEAAIGEQE